MRLVAACCGLLRLVAAYCGLRGLLRLVAAYTVAQRGAPGPRRGTVLLTAVRTRARAAHTAHAHLLRYIAACCSLLRLVAAAHTAHAHAHTRDNTHAARFVADWACWPVRGRVRILTVRGAASRQGVAESARRAGRDTRPACQTCLVRLIAAY